MKKILFVFFVILIVGCEIAYAKKSRWVRFRNRFTKVAIGATLGAVTGGIGAIVASVPIATGVTIGAISSGIASAENNRASVGYNSDVHNYVDKHTNNDVLKSPKIENANNINDSKQKNKIEQIKINKQDTKDKIEEKPQNNLIVKANVYEDHKTLDMCMKGARKAFLYNSQISNLMLSFTNKKYNHIINKMMPELDSQIWHDEKEKCKKIYNSSNI